MFSSTLVIFLSLVISPFSNLFCSLLKEEHLFKGSKYLVTTKSSPYKFLFLFPRIILMDKGVLEIRENHN